MTRTEILEVAKPILFNTEMVRAIQDGRKTVTRRPLKPHNAVKAKKYGYEQGSGLWYDDTFNEGDKDTHIKDYSVSCCWIGIKIYIQKYAPYKVGDILYVRETWAYGFPLFVYRADGEEIEISKPNGTTYSFGKAEGLKWHPSTRMPKEAARIFLRVTDVRVERLQDITDDQAIREGCNGVFYGNGENMGDGWEITPVDEYIPLWNSTVKKSDLDIFGWDANPRVWVIEFERVEVEP